MKKYLVLFIISFTIFIPTYLLSQEEDYKPPRFIAKIALPTPYNFAVPAIQVSLEHSLSKRFSLQYDLGYVQPNDINLNSEGKGYRFAVSLLRYFKQQQRHKSNSYLGLIFRFQQTFSDRAIIIEREGGAYFQHINTVLQKNRSGVYITYGFNRRFGTKFILDFSVGPGVQQISRTYKDLPDDANIEIPNNGFPIFETANNGKDYLPFLMAQFKIGYILK